MVQSSHYRPPEFSWHPQYVICMPRDRGSTNWPLFVSCLTKLGRQPFKKWGLSGLSVCLASNDNILCWMSHIFVCIWWTLFIVLHYSFCIARVHELIQMCAQMVSGNMWTSGNCTLVPSRQLTKDKCIVRGFWCYVWTCIFEYESGDALIHAGSALNWIMLLLIFTSDYLINIPHVDPI